MREDVGECQRCVTRHSGNFNRRGCGPDNGDRTIGGDVVRRTAIGGSTMEGADDMGKWGRKGLVS